LEKTLNSLVKTAAYACLRVKAASRHLRYLPSPRQGRGFSGFGAGAGFPNVEIIYARL
jgi:hypothetical protein